MLTPQAKQILIDNYRKLLLEHGQGPGVAHYKSVEAQFLRFEQLVKVGDFDGKSVLEIGCGIGDFCGFLLNLYPDMKYMGIDIVPELVERAMERFPQQRFECRDVLERRIDEKFDYVLISGVFNNAIPMQTEFLESLTSESFALAKSALAFNFISTYANYTEPEFAYHDPCRVLKHCIEKLSKRTAMFHHYERADVSVFVYRLS